MAFVEFENVGKTYQMGEVKINALHDATFQIEKGELVVIVGPSGAGKTTLLNILGGMDSLTTGKVLLDGRDISGMDRRELTQYRRMDVGFVFQFYNLIGNLNALENVELANQICKHPLPAAQVLKDVGLEARMKNFPSQLSGGEQQRVAIARALATKPEIIYFDEPTSALDPELTGEVLSVMRRLAEEGMTMLVVTHELGFARNVSTKTMFMDKGTVVESGPSAELFANPKEERTRAFLNTITQHEKE